MSPRKSCRKSACFSSTRTSMPARASRRASIIPAGPAPTIQQQVVTAAEAAGPAVGCPAIGSAVARDMALGLPPQRGKPARRPAAVVLEAGPETARERGLFQEYDADPVGCHDQGRVAQENSGVRQNCEPEEVERTRRIHGIADDRIGAGHNQPLSRIE